MMNLLFLATAVAVIGVMVQLCPIKFLIPESLHINSTLTPSLGMVGLKRFGGEYPSGFRGGNVTINVGPLGYILIVRPNIPTAASHGQKDDDITDWVNENTDWLNTHIVEYGGVLLREFNVVSVFEFDDIVGTIHSDANGTGIYLGTAPRARVPNTRFVSTASEIPKIFSIPTHLELCFTPNPPPRLYFYAGKPNTPPGGQTPFTDFRQVWRDMSPDLKNKLLSRGLVYQRRYFNARPKMRFRSQKAWNLDAMQHKSWQDMYGTYNKTIVEEMSREQQFTPIWDTKFNLLLTHHAEVAKQHPITGEEYFSTHFNVLHASTHIVPYLWDAQLFNSRKSLLVGGLITLITQLRLLIGYPYGHDMIHRDTGTSVSYEDGITIRQMKLRNTWQFDWNEGDVMMLDNLRMAHGRTPWFDGDRRVYVAWG